MVSDDFSCAMWGRSIRQTSTTPCGGAGTGHLVPGDGGLDLVVRTTGDLDVDAHHTVEDTALAVGAALAEARAAWPASAVPSGALADRSGIRDAAAVWGAGWTRPATTAGAPAAVKFISASMNF